MQERRFIRYASDIPIKFVVSNMVGEHHHLLKDAGCGGVCFHAGGWIEPGTDIKVCIPFSDEACNADGKVAWCRKDDKGLYLVGIAFDQRVGESAMREIHLIERFKERSLRNGVRLTGEEVVARMESRRSESIDKVRIERARLD